MAPVEAARLPLFGPARRQFLRGDQARRLHQVLELAQRQQRAHLLFVLRGVAALTGQHIAIDAGIEVAIGILEGRLPGNEVRDLGIADAVPALRQVLAQHLLVDQLLQHTAAQLRAVEHGRVEVLAQHLLETGIARIDLVLQLEALDGVAVDVGDGIAGAAAAEGLDTKESEGDRNDPDDHPGQRPGGLIANRLQHCLECPAVPASCRR